MLPPRSFLPGYLLRGLILWVAIHLGAGFAATAGSGAGFDLLSTIFLHAVVVPFVVGAVYLASRVDDRVRGDDAFLELVGVRPAAAAGVSAAVALACELALQAAGVLV